MQVHLANYINTIVFCVLASALSLLLLFVMFNARDYMPYLLSCEIGLLVVVVYTVSKLLNTISDGTGEDASKPSTLDAKKVTTCPDYFTRDGDTCRNQYSVDNKTYTYVGTGINSISLNAVTDEGSNLCADTTYTNTNIPWVDLQAACGIIANP